MSQIFRRPTPFYKKVWFWLLPIVLAVTGYVYLELQTEASWIELEYLTLWAEYQPVWLDIQSLLNKYWFYPVFCLTGGILVFNGYKLFRVSKSPKQWYSFGVKPVAINLLVLAGFIVSLVPVYHVQILPVVKEVAYKDKSSLCSLADNFYRQKLAPIGYGKLDVLYNIQSIAFGHVNHSLLAQLKDLGKIGIFQVVDCEISNAKSGNSIFIASDLELGRAEFTKWLEASTGKAEEEVENVEEEPQGLKDIEDGSFAKWQDLALYVLYAFASVLALAFGVVILKIFPNIAYSIRGLMSEFNDLCLGICHLLRLSLSLFGGVFFVCSLLVALILYVLLEFFDQALWLKDFLVIGAGMYLLMGFTLKTLSSFFSHESKGEKQFFEQLFWASCLGITALVIDSFLEDFWKANELLWINTVKPLMLSGSLCGYLAVVLSLVMAKVRYEEQVEVKTPVILSSLVGVLVMAFSYEMVFDNKYTEDGNYSGEMEQIALASEGSRFTESLGFASLVGVEPNDYHHKLDDTILYAAFNSNIADRNHLLGHVGHRLRPKDFVMEEGSTESMKTPAMLSMLRLKGWFNNEPPDFKKFVASFGVTKVFEGVLNEAYLNNGSQADSARQVIFDLLSLNYRRPVVVKTESYNSVYQRWQLEGLFVNKMKPSLSYKLRAKFLDGTEMSEDATGKSYAEMLADAKAKTGIDFADDLRRFVDHFEGEDAVCRKVHDNGRIEFGKCIFRLVEQKPQVVLRRAIKFPIDGIAIMKDKIREGYFFLDGDNPHFDKDHVKGFARFLNLSYALRQSRNLQFQHENPKQERAYRPGADLEKHEKAILCEASRILEESDLKRNAKVLDYLSVSYYKYWLENNCYSNTLTAVAKLLPHKKDIGENIHLAKN